MSNGKGDARRPASVSGDELAARWAQTFRRDRESGEAVRERFGSETLPVERHHSDESS